MPDPELRFASSRFVLLVTGASRGLGHAVARAWARPGSRIAIAARGSADLERTAGLLRRAGAEVLAIAGDVGEPDFARYLVRRTEERLGPVTHLVTCASSLGAVPLRPIADVPDGAWDEAVRTNLLGTVRLWREVLPRMEGDLGGGRMLHVSSDAACEAYPHWGPYGATKAAVDHLVRILAAEFAEHHVHNVFAYALDPGDMDTDLHRAAIPGADPQDLQRPEEVAPKLLRVLLADPPLASGRYVAAQLTPGPAGGASA